MRSFSKKIFVSMTVGVLAGCATAPVDYTAADAPYAAPLTRTTAVRPVIGLVLGAGGSRGFAHVGVLKALEDAGIEADVIVGVSSGAVVAALHAGGMRAAELKATALDIEDDDLLDFTLFGPGMIQGGRLQAYINETLRNRPIEALQKPFAAVVAESVTNRMVISDKADIVIRPQTIRTRITDFSQKIANLAAGEEAAQEVVPQIRELLVRVAAAKSQPLQVGTAR